MNTVNKQRLQMELSKHLSALRRVDPRLVAEFLHACEGNYSILETIGFLRDILIVLPNSEYPKKYHRNVVCNTRNWACRVCHKYGY